MFVSTPQGVLYFCHPADRLWRTFPPVTFFPSTAEDVYYPKSALCERDSLSRVKQTDSFSDWCSSCCCGSHCCTCSFHTSSAQKAHVHSASVQTQTAFYFTVFSGVAFTAKKFNLINMFKWFFKIYFLDASAAICVIMSCLNWAKWNWKNGTISLDWQNISFL